MDKFHPIADLRTINEKIERLLDDISSSSSSTIESLTSLSSISTSSSDTFDSISSQEFEYPPDCPIS